MTAFTLLTPPAVEPVSLSDAKAQARIESTADDSLVTALITAARQWAEQYTARAFITQTWRLWLDAAPYSQEWWDGLCDGPVTGFGEAGYVDLARPPLIAVTSVQVFDDSDTGTVWAASNYFVDNIRVPGRLALRSGATWPSPDTAHQWNYDRIHRRLWRQCIFCARAYSVGYQTARGALV